MNELREHNESLTTENDSFFETAESEQQEILFLRCHSYNTHQENNDLQTELVKYQNISKQLQSENKLLQTENEKYKLILEKLTEKLQKKDEIYKNNKINLENKLKQLEIENQSLQQQISRYHNDQNEQIEYVLSLPKYGSYDNDDQELQLSEQHKLDRVDSEIIQKRKYSLPKDISPEALGRSRSTSNVSQLSMDRDYDFPLIMHKFEESDIEQHIKENSDNDDINNDDDKDMIEQLIQFGYEEGDIMMAMATVNDKRDINEILEILESDNDSAIDIAFEDIMEEEIKEQESVIRKLVKSNDESKVIINKLKNKIKDLKKQKKEIENKLKDIDMGTSTKINFFKWW